jgi:O-antigen/teichoic acid export membrane protein
VNQLREQIVRGSFWSASQNWGMQALSFLVFVIMSRLIAPGAFGLLALASVFLAFVQSFLDQGIASALIQRADVEQAHFDTAFWMNVSIGLLMTALGIICAKGVAIIFHEPELESVIRWLSLVFLLTGLSSTQQAILQREMAFRSLALRSLLAGTIGGAAGIMLAYFGFGVWSLVAQNLVMGVVGVLALWRVSNWRPRLFFSSTHFWELQRFGLNIVGTNILNFFNRRADDLLIGYFLGATALGYYTIAYRILLVLTDLLTGFANSVAFPVFARLQAERERMLQAFYRATEYMSYISFPVFVGVSLLAPGIVRIFFGQQWGQSIPALQILMFVGILHSLLYFHSTLMVAMGKPAWRLWLTFMNALANVIAFMFVVRWGITAVAAAYVLRAYLLLPVEIWALKHLIDLNLKTYFGRYIIPIMAVTIMAGTVLGFQRYVFSSLIGEGLKLFFSIILGVLVYFGMVALLNPSILLNAAGMLRMLVGRRAAHE